MTEAATPQEFFQNILPQVFRPEKSAGVDVVVQITLNGEGGGNWVVEIKNQQLTLREGIDASANLALKMAAADFLELVNRRISAERAFLSGKVQFKGNIALAMKLRDAGFF